MYLYVITDTSIQNRYSHLELAEFAIRGGADAVQLREKQMKTAELLGIAMAMRAMCNVVGVKFIVNDRVDIALMSDADGVHLGCEDLPIREARAILGPQKIIGATAGTVEEAVRMEKEGANYIGFGHIFPTTSKSKATASKGVEMLSTVCKAVSIPVIAIGGINLSNVANVLEAHPAGVAVLNAVCAAENPEEASKHFRQRLTHPLPEHGLKIH